QIVPKSYSAPGSTSNPFMKGYVLLNAPYINQNEAGAPMGCEAASLLQALRVRGKATNYSLRNFLREMPISPTGDPNKGFGGTPYAVTPGVYQSIYPEPLANWGKRYANVENISGSSSASLQNHLQLGNPIVVYVTLDFQTPVYNRYFFGVAIDNAHIMTLDGYNFSTQQYHVSDPVRGKYWVNATTFERSYNVKKFAVAVK
ncbi:C39 family peptidase, partial [Enterococcus florum]|uniref:C39 family peptidase n=1 Tax=Enterococcus florum TaxID=2480627 RepID=UPI001588AFE7